MGEWWLKSAGGSIYIYIYNQLIRDPVGVSTISPNSLPLFLLRHCWKQVYTEKLRRPVKGLLKRFPVEAPFKKGRTAIPACQKCSTGRTFALSLERKEWRFIEIHFPRPGDSRHQQIFRLYIYLRIYIYTYVHVRKNVCNIHMYVYIYICFSIGEISWPGPGFPLSRALGSKWGSAEATSASHRSFRSTPTTQPGKSWITRFWAFRNTFLEYIEWQKVSVMSVSYCFFKNELKKNRHKRNKQKNKSSLWNPLVKKNRGGGELQPGSFHQDGSAQLRLGEPRRIAWCWMLRVIIFPVQSRVHSISGILKDFTNFTKRLFEDIEPAICQIKSPESKRKGLQIFRDPQTQPFVFFWAGSRFGGPHRLAYGTCRWSSGGSRRQRLVDLLGDVCQWKMVN